MQGWACVLFKRTQHSLCFFALFIKEVAFFAFFAFFYVLYKRTPTFFAFFCILNKRMWHSLFSFAFFIKQCGILCVFLRYLWKKWRSLRSFRFFIKERGRSLHSFWFHKSYKNDKSCKKKECKRTVHSFLGLKKLS